VPCSDTLEGTLTASLTATASNHATSDMNDMPQLQPVLIKGTLTRDSCLFGMEDIVEIALDAASVNTLYLASFQDSAVVCWRIQVFRNVMLHRCECASLHLEISSRKFHNPLILCHFPEKVHPVVQKRFSSRMIPLVKKVNKEQKKGKDKYDLNRTTCEILLV
jgi:hypothetical protein